MIDRIFYDSFTKQYAETFDQNSPPERYPVTIFRGTASPTYIESWAIDDKNEKYINIAFDEETYEDKLRYDVVIKNTCEQNFCELKKLRYVVVPYKKFKEILEKEIGIQND
jgi:hypothetical protein